MDIEVAVTRSPPGGPRAVLEASALAAERDEAAVLALVVATEGSTYVRSGTMALFGGESGQVGWLSGGCLEPEIERRAQRAAAAGGMDWLDIDTRDDEDLFSGSALGCRGRLRLALLPLRSMPRWGELVQAWLRAEAPLCIAISAAGELRAHAGALEQQWQLAPLSAGDVGSGPWSVDIAAPPTVAIFGAGPETPALLPALRTLGWMVTLVEQRPRWAPLAATADTAIERAPQAAIAALANARCDAALVMHHHFELDREALAALADTGIGFIGLLGPPRRRDDLFRVLPPAACVALAPRLHAPVGLNLGGHGPEAIALSIAAQLHAYRHAP
ncbi:XdhC family protein [Lysobacter solisilvae (ex Woo and Kim 2020)]|uniref:XdhC family protein n=1 Tax=Agrilutibacter terrestris TaxID=2865112 RepID=A0A7H0FUJ1_9GAMM|nr:XdhC/CoxI family protein [Lysobacter terrestris]QNP39707.1 XdhC family protein [Lysobacter terrestris]